MPSINVVFDFDSTLATSFIGGEMYRDHVPEDDENRARQRFLSDATSLREYQEEIFNLVDESVAQMSKRASEVTEIRPLTQEVCQQVWTSGGSVAVASAGLDFYIQPVLDKAGLEQIDVHSGKIVSNPTELPPFRYDYPSSFRDTCESDGVTCKCAVVNHLRDDNGGTEAEVVFVGDGDTSDACAAKNAADTVFATGRLLAYCNNNGVPAKEFHEDFEPLLSYVLSKTSPNGAR
jgi:2-hydroxy-3-keto-5-methylthiopentenyl-1-phosphate phosphatase